MLKEIYGFGLGLLVAGKARAVLKANFGANAELDYLTGKEEDYQQRLGEILQTKRDLCCSAEFVVAIRLAGVYLDYLDYCKEVANEDFYSGAGLTSGSLSFGQFLELRQYKKLK